MTKGGPKVDTELTLSQEHIKCILRAIPPERQLSQLNSFCTSIEKVGAPRVLSRSRGNNLGIEELVRAIVYVFPEHGQELHPGSLLTFRVLQCILVPFLDLDPVDIAWCCFVHPRGCAHVGGRLPHRKRVWS